MRGRRACCGDAGAEPPDRRWRPASEGEARALRVVRHAVRRPRWRRSPNHQGPGRNAPGRLPKGAQRAREPRQPRYPNPVRRPRLTEGEGGGRVAKLGVHSEPGYQGRRPPDARLVAESGPGRNALVRTWAECPQEVQGRGPRAACPVYSGRVGGRGAPSIRVGRAERAIARAAASHQSLSGGTPSWSEWSAGWSPPHEGQPEGLSPRRRRVAARRRAAEPRRGAPTGVTSGGWVRFEPKARGTDRGRRPSDRSRWHRRRTEPPKATTRRYRALCTMIRRREAPARGARGAESPRRAGKPARRPRGAAEPACEANRLACDGRPDAERRYGRSDSGVSGGGAPDHRRNRRAAAEPAEGGLAESGPVGRVQGPRSAKGV